MAKQKEPVTPAIRALKAGKIKYIPHIYNYEERGGTRVAAREIGVDEHLTVKSLVMEDEAKAPLMVLMHGDREVSTKNLARALGKKSIGPCAPETANRHTGYMVGGTSPMGTKKQLPVYVEASILELETIYVNAGKRGFLVEMSPSDLGKVVKLIPVEAAQE